MMIKQSAPDLVFVDRQPNSLLVAESEMSLAEERARLLVYIFGKITSVVFDINSF
jgi:DNA-binding winged helix-turn-helix (wHTH) protein